MANDPSLKYGFCADSHDVFQTYVFGDVAFKSIKALTEQAPINKRWAPDKNCFYNAFIALPAGTVDVQDTTGGSGHGTAEERRQHLPMLGQQKRRKHGEKLSHLPAPIPPGALSATALTQVDFARTLYREDDVRYQGFCASCVAFALVAVVEGTARKQGLLARDTKLSEASLFFRGGGSCWNGWTVREGLEQLKTGGVLPWDMYPYAGYEPAGDDPDKVPVLKAKKYVRIQTVADAKNWLGAPDKKGGPLFAVLGVHPEFFLYGKNPTDPKKPAIYQPVSEFPVALHAVSIVGFDDSLAYETRVGNAYVQKTGCFKVRNCFSPNWGQNGYAWIPYESDIWMGFHDQSGHVLQQIEFWGIEEFA